MQPKAVDAIQLIIIFAFFVTICSCATPGRVIMEDHRGPVIIESKGEKEHYPDDHEQGTVIIGSGRRGHYYSGEDYKIPPGHMPPPGKCRIWYPDSPSGKQPPPGDCDDLRYRVPPDAWLLEG